MDILARENNEKTNFFSIKLIRGDITKLEVDAIVNAAHEGLTGGGGVDGAIHKISGQKLLGECLSLYGCHIGEARITNGYDLPAKYIIHTVGPTWMESHTIEQKAQYKKQLSSCYEYSMLLAELQGLKTIAFPCISTGAYCFPKTIACDIALTAIQNFFKNNEARGTYLQHVKFVCFDEENFNCYKELGVIVENKS